MATVAYLFDQSNHTLKPQNDIDVGDLLNFGTKKSFIQPQVKIDYYINDHVNFCKEEYQPIVNFLIQYQYELQVVLHINGVGDLYFITQ